MLSMLYTNAGYMKGLVRNKHNTVHYLVSILYLDYDELVIYQNRGENPEMEWKTRQTDCTINTRSEKKLYKTLSYEC